MKAFLILAVLVAVEARAKPGTCRVGEWSDWSQWRTGTNHPERAQSWPAGEYDPTAPDAGRETFTRVMEEKQAYWEKRQACIADGSCPEMTSHTEDGPFTCIGGVAGGIPCSNINQLDYVPLNGLIGGAGNDIWGWTDSVTGQEWAIMGSSTGTTFIDVSNPTDVQVEATMSTQTSSSSWRDMKTVGDWVWVVSEASGHGIQGFDLTRLRTQTGSLTPDVHYDVVGNCHNIVANEATQTIYGVGCTQGFNGCSGGLHAVDVSDPRNPVEVGCFGGDGYVHDAQCIVYTGPDTAYSGREICFCYNEDTFTIVDAQNKGAMSVISRTDYNNAQYTHQGWVTEDFQYALMDDEQDEQAGNGFTQTYVWDISDLDNPTLENTFEAAHRSIDHNQYMIGDLTYQANYESGLRVLRLTGTSLAEVAYFDVYPSRDFEAFNGAWSVYPYFASGTIVISSINDGLYVVELDVAAVEAQRNATPRSQRSRAREIFETDSIEFCPPLMEYQHI